MLSVMKNGLLNYLVCLRLTVWSGLLFACLWLGTQSSGYADSTGTDMVSHWAVRFEISEKNTFVDEFNQLPEDLLNEVAQYSEYLESNQNGLLLYWSFPEEVSPEVVSCLKPTKSSARAQLLTSRSGGQIPGFTLSPRNQLQTIKFNLSASSGVLLLALDGYEFDVFCPEARYSQVSGSSGKMIAAYFVKSSIAQALSVPQKLKAENRSVAETNRGGNSTLDFSGSEQGLPVNSEGSNEPASEYVHQYGGGDYSNFPGKPKKGGQFQLQPVQIVIMLPAISLGAEGLIEIPIDYSSPSQPDSSDIVTQLYDPPENEQGFSVVILEVTDSFGGMHQVRIEQQYWIRIVEQDLHRNAAFLYNLAVLWFRHNQQRTELEKTLKQLMAAYDQEVTTLLSGNTTTEDNGQIFQRAQVVFFDLEQLWQSLARLIPRRLRVILDQQHPRYVVQRLWNAFVGSPATSVNTEKTETAPVKGIISYSNGTETGAASTTQTSGTYSTAGHSRFGGTGGAFPRGGLPFRGFPGGGAGGWTPPGPGELPPVYTAAVSDLNAYLADDFSKELIVNGKDVNARIRILSYDITPCQKAIMLWMVGEKPLVALDGVKKNQLSSQQGRFRRGYLYVMADVLGLHNVKASLDPKNLLTHMDNLDILWQTTYSSRYMKSEDALDIIAKLNMVTMAQKFGTEHFQSLISFVTNSLGKISFAQPHEKIYAKSSQSDGGQEYAILRLAEKIYQSSADDPQISDTSRRSHISWNNFLTRYLPNTIQFPQPMPTFYDHMPREKSTPAGMGSQPVAYSPGTVQTNPPVCLAGQGGFSGRPSMPAFSPPQLSFGGGESHPPMGTSGMSGPAPLTSWQRPPGDDQLPSYSTAIRQFVPGRTGRTVPGSSFSHSPLSASLSSEVLPREKRPLQSSQEYLPETKKSRPAPSSLQGLYTVLKGQQERFSQGQGSNIDLLGELLEISEAELTELAFILEVPLLGDNLTSTGKEPLASKIKSLPPGAILAALKVMIDGEVDHQVDNAQTWARQAVVIAGRRLSPTQIVAHILPLLRARHSEVERFYSCPRPLLCVVEWWANKFSYNNINIREVMEWLSQAQPNEASKQLNDLISFRQQYIDTFRQVIPEYEMKMIQSLRSRGSNEMLSNLAELSKTALNQYRGYDPKPLVEQLLLSEMFIGAFSWRMVQTRFEKTGFTESAKRIKEYLDGVQDVTALPVAPPPASHRPSDSHRPPTTPQLVTTRLQLLQAQLKSSPSFIRAIGHYVKTESGEWFIQARNENQRDFLVSQLASTRLEQHSDLYLTLPDNIAFAEAVQHGSRIFGLSQQINLLNGWIQHIFSCGYGIPELPTIESLRMVRESQHLFVMKVPASGRMPGFAFVPSKQLQQLAEIIINMVLRATGASLETPKGMRSPAKATRYKYLKQNEVVASEYHLVIDMAIELNGNISGLSLRELSSILTRTASSPEKAPVEQELFESVHPGPTEPGESDNESVESFQSATEGYRD